MLNGRLRLRVEFRGNADARMDISQTLQAGYDVRAGIEYIRGTGWQVLQEATPWYKYDLSGEADAHAYVELRFVPDLEIAFYDMVTGRLIVEPYLFGEMEIEGHFQWQAGSDIGSGGDADYRFTQLDIGGGVDARLRAGLEAFDRQIIGFPSRDPDELLVLDEANMKAPVRRAVVMGLPTLLPAVAAEVRNPERCDQIAVAATVTDLPNPFGGDSLNPFDPLSASWRVVFFNGGPLNGTERIEMPTPPDPANPYLAWFKAEQSGQYTLRFGGNSFLGSAVRQYEELVVDYEQSTEAGLERCCDVRNFTGDPVWWNPQYENQHWTAQAVSCRYMDNGQLHQWDETGYIFDNGYKWIDLTIRIPPPPASGEPLRNLSKAWFELSPSDSLFRWGKEKTDYTARRVDRGQCNHSAPLALRERGCNRSDPHPELCVPER